MLQIDEEIRDDGEVQRVFLRAIAPGSDGGEHGVYLTADDGLRGALPVKAVAAVMRRYGKPLDPEVSAQGPGLDLGHGRTLQVLRYRARVDASSRDYLVWRAPGEEPLAALSRGITAALRYLVESMAARRRG